MLVQGLLGAFSKIYILNKLLKGLGAFLLAGAMLSWVVEQLGPPDGTALVHVTERDVEVLVGGQSFHLADRTYAPIVCPLQAGRHRLCMKRGDRVLYEEWFTVRRGEEVILTASCPQGSLDGTSGPSALDASRPGRGATDARRPGGNFGTRRLKLGRRID